MITGDGNLIARLEGISCDPDLGELTAIVHLDIPALRLGIADVSIQQKKCMGLNEVEFNNHADNRCQLSPAVHSYNRVVRMRRKSR